MPSRSVSRTHGSPREYGHVNGGEAVEAAVDAVAEIVPVAGQEEPGPQARDHERRGEHDERDGQARGDADAPPSRPRPREGGAAARCSQRPQRDHAGAARVGHEHRVVGCAEDRRARRTRRAAAAARVGAGRFAISPRAAGGAAASRSCSRRHLLGGRAAAEPVHSAAGHRELGLLARRAAPGVTRKRSAAAARAIPGGGACAPARDPEDRARALDPARPPARPSSASISASRACSGGHERRSGSMSAARRSPGRSREQPRGAAEVHAQRGGGAKRLVERLPRRRPARVDHHERAQVDVGDQPALDHLPRRATVGQWIREAGAPSR